MLATCQFARVRKYLHIVWQYGDHLCTYGLLLCCSRAFWLLLWQSFMLLFAENNVPLCRRLVEPPPAVLTLHVIYSSHCTHHAAQKTATLYNRF